MAKRVSKKVAAPAVSRKGDPTLPEPVKFDSRICFAISYYASEADANKADAEVRKRGYTYNGGWFDGMPCGRDVKWDYVDEKLGPLFAVTS
jgi:hypothetical protein